MKDAPPAHSDAAEGYQQHWSSLLRWAVPLLLILGLVSLGAAVDRGVLRSVDRWGYQHRAEHRAVLQQLTDPADVPVSGLILLAAVMKLHLRTRVAAAWIAAFMTTLLIEVIGKATVASPFSAPNTLLATPITLGSFPSGHTLRAIVVAGALATAWPRFRWLAVIWAAGTATLVELSGMHSPSEVFGGILGGVAVVSAAWAAGVTQSHSSVLRP